MQEIITNQDIEKLDLTKVAALQQKRTLAFLNHFMITTVQFLNTFSKTCEKKLMTFEQKLEKVEAAMILLEARLSSIPEINETPQKDVKVESVSQDNSQIKSEDQTDGTVEKESKESEDKSDIDVSKDTDTIQTKPEYVRFIKLVQVGVPVAAVKLKVSLEGLDPDEFESLLKK